MRRMPFWRPSARQRQALAIHSPTCMVAVLRMSQMNTRPRTTSKISWRYILSPNLMTQARLYPLLLPCEPDILADHLGRVRRGAQQHRIAWRPEVLGEVLVLDVGEVREDQTRGLLADGANAT